jgi:hypothetical protein
VSDTGSTYGAAAGAVAVALFAAGGLLVGDRPGFDASAAAVAADLADRRTQVQLACALFAAMAPLFIWFLATVASLARDASPAAGRAGAGAGGAVAFGCGLVFVALFEADVATLAVAALRPENEAAAQLLRDYELLLMGTAAFAAAAVPAACAVVALRHGALWPHWVGLLAAAAAAAYALRAGTLFTTDGPFAADGLLGVYVPVIAFAVWLLAASVTLARYAAREASRNSR